MKRFILQGLTMLAFLAAFFGVSAAAPIKALPAVLTLETYDTGGELASERKIDATDPVYQRLAALLTKEGGQWTQSFTSYKTGPFILRGEHLIIRCYPDRVILDVTNASGSKSYKMSAPHLLADLGLLSKR